MINLALNIEKYEKEYKNKLTASTVNRHELEEFIKCDEELTAFKERLKQATVNSHQLLEAIKPLIGELDDFDRLTVDILELLKRRLEKEK